MSRSPTPDSPPPLEYPSETERDDSPESASPLYQSLVESLKHPSSANIAWLDTVAKENNPRTLHMAPFNDGSLHWVDTSGSLLCLAFPAKLEMNGTFGRTGPYFSLETDQGLPKVLTSYGQD
jgi:hypothetical protein